MRRAPSVMAMRRGSAGAALAGMVLALVAVFVATGGCARGGGVGRDAGGGSRQGAAAGGGAEAAYDPVRYGEQLFANMCAGCHGEGARGGTAVSLARPELARKYPTDAALLRRVEEGDPATGMPPCPVGKLLPRQKEALAAYLRSLWGAGGAR